MISVANVACRYILEQPAVGGIIIGARLGESEHLQDNLGLFKFSLDETSKSEIGAALANLLPVPGNCGDEYRKPPFLTATGDLSHHLDTIPPPYLVETGADGLVRVIKLYRMGGDCRLLPGSPSRRIKFGLQEPRPRTVIA